MQLRDQFFEVLSDLGLSESEVLPYWSEITDAYSDTNRYYHTLDHLQHLYTELSEVKTLINDWSTVLFALFYHDIVYSPRSFRNELKSAELAGERLRALGVSESKIEHCRDQILATKKHKISEDTDTNYFIDADLSILGQSEETYQNYIENIRKEYKLVPGGIYRKGRIKVIKHFLSMDRIYKTDHFYEKYEEKARANLASELNRL